MSDENRKSSGFAVSGFSKAAQIIITLFAPFFKKVKPNSLAELFVNNATKMAGTATGLDFRTVIPILQRRDRYIVVKSALARIMAFGIFKHEQKAKPAHNSSFHST